MSSDGSSAGKAPDGGPGADRAQEYLDIAGVIIVAIAPDERVMLINRRGRETLGLSESEIVGRNWFDTCIPPRVREEVRTVFARVVSGEIEPFEHYDNPVLTAGGVERLVAWHNAVLRNDAGEILATLSSGEDVTERRKAEETIRHLAYHDPLTGLPNRTWLAERIERAAAGGASGAPRFALLLVDLARFEEINCTLGLAVGDALVREAGSRLGAVLDGRAEIARLHCDSFAALLPDVDSPDAASEAARGVVEAFERPVVLECLALDVSARAGVVLCPDHGTEVHSLLRRARVALDVARRTGSGWAVYSAKSDPYTPARLALTAGLRRAIDENRLFLHYQPLVDLKREGVAGVEALVRWRHPDMGTVAPEHFIGLAEHSGAIRSLTDWVVAEALRECAAWRDAGWPIPVSVNVSARNLADPRFVDRVDRLISEAGASPSWLGMEVTESAIMEDPERAGDVLAQLGRRGIRLSIDDFGTGYSSLAALRNLPVHALKIDRSFVQGLAARRYDAGFFGAIVDLGHRLDLTLVAEGIETPESLDAVARLGCDQAQGFHVARPMAAADLVGWFRRSRWAIGVRTTQP